MFIVIKMEIVSFSLSIVKHIIICLNVILPVAKGVKVPKIALARNNHTGGKIRDYLGERIDVGNENTLYRSWQTTSFN